MFLIFDIIGIYLVLLWVLVGVMLFYSLDGGYYCVFYLLNVDIWY